MTTTDHPVIAMVEDGLVELVLKAGYVPLERDAHLLTRLFHEQADGMYGIPVVLDSLVVHDPEQLLCLDTDLSAADYLVSYRVLEAGIRYRKADSMGKVKREALVRLNVRIERAPDGDILWAGEMNGEFTDVIDKELVVPLSDYHYSFFGHRLPLQKKRLTYRSLQSLGPATSDKGKTSVLPIRSFSFGLAKPTGDFGDGVNTGPCVAYNWMRPTGGDIYIGASNIVSFHSLNEGFYSDGHWMMAEALFTGRYQSPTGGYGMLGLGANYSRFNYDVEVYDAYYDYFYTYSRDDNATNFAWSIGGGYLLNEQWDFQAMLHCIEGDDRAGGSRYFTFTAGVVF